MFNLIRFDKPLDMVQDHQEVLSRTFLTFLHLSCGKKVKVTLGTKIEFTNQNQLNLITRIATGILAIVTFPLSILGIILQNYSNTYNQTLNEYIRVASLSLIQSIPPVLIQERLDLQKRLDLQTENSDAVLATPISKPKFEIEEPLKNPLEKIKPVVKPIVEESFLTSDQIRAQLAHVDTEWCNNFIENLKVSSFYKIGTSEKMKEVSTHPILKNPPRTLEERLKSERQLNEQIFAFVKNAARIETPADILWSWNKNSGMGIDYPTPIVEDGTIVEIEEGYFYKFRIYSDSLEKIEKFDTSDPYFGALIQYKAGKIHLYLDGRSKILFLRINNNIYPYEKGFGLKNPTYTFEAGDQCFDNRKYLFEVLRSGKIMYPNQKKRCYPAISEQAKQQIYQFERDYNKKRLPGYSDLTKLNQAAIIPMDKKLEPGFALHRFGIDIVEDPKSVPFEQMIPDNGDLVFFDLEKDPILSKLLQYFKAEFELIKYTDQQKLMRLSSFAAVAIENNDSSLFNLNYYLGNILLAGKGKCRHRSFLVKILADHLDIPCGIVCAGVVQHIPLRDSNNKIMDFIQASLLAAHVWNVFCDDKGHHWILDSMNQTCFRVDNPPGDLDLYKKEIQEFYGLV